MKRNKFIALGTSVVLSTVILATLAMPAAHAETQGFTPIWSDTSETLNRSTQALAEGQAVLAVRLAKETKADALSYGDRLIAAHNLCIAHVGQNVKLAEPYCREAMSAPSRMVVKPVGGMLKIRSGRATFVPSMGAQLLTSIVGRNIQHAYDRTAPQIAEFKSVR
jgi:hypothetical protein